MELDLKDKKGIIVLMCGDTQNSFSYKDNEELFELLEKFKKNTEVIDIYDFTDKFVFYLFKEEDIEELKNKVKESE